MYHEICLIYVLIGFHSQAAFLENGCQIGFYHGDPKVIAEDIKTLKPTIFAGVPRFYCKIYDKVGCVVGVASDALLLDGSLDNSMFDMPSIFAKRCRQHVCMCQPSNINTTAD